MHLYPNRLSTNSETIDTLPSVLLQFFPIIFIVVIVCLVIVLPLPKKKQQAQSEHIVNNDINNAVAQSTLPIMPMKWYKFLIYFSLFFSFIANLSIGLQYISGTIYLNDNTTADAIYSQYGLSLKITDVLYGFFVLFLSAFSLYTRQQLVKFKVSAPSCVNSLFLANAFLNSAYSIVSTAFINGAVPPSTSSYAVSLIVVAVIIVYCNIRYFKKRQHLFNN